MTPDSGESRSPVTGGRLALYALVGTVVLVAVVLGCSLLGQYRMTASIWQIRLMRLSAAALVGAALASGGVAMQGLLRNPLAEPYILGISSGAGVGVLLGGVLARWMAQRWHVTAEWATEPVMAFAGALLTCAVVYGIAQRRGRLDPYVLLLSGVIVNAFNGAVMLGVLMLLDPLKVARFARWGMGVLPEQFSSAQLAGCGTCIVVGWVLLLRRGAWFNALGLGDDVAASLGVRVHRLRIETFAVVAMMTAAAVALSGPIGFLGLIVPHLCRLAFGADHRRLAVVSGFGGAVFLVAVAMFCHEVGFALNVGIIPLGVVTALCGGPFFIYLLRTRTGGGAA